MSGIGNLLAKMDGSSRDCDIAAMVLSYQAGLEMNVAALLIHVYAQGRFDENPTEQNLLVVIRTTGAFLRADNKAQFDALRRRGA